MHGNSNLLLEYFLKIISVMFVFCTGIPSRVQRYHRQITENNYTESKSPVWQNPIH